MTIRMTAYMTGQRNLPEALKMLHALKTGSGTGISNSIWLPKVTFGDRAMIHSIAEVTAIDII